MLLVGGFQYVSARLPRWHHPPRDVLPPAVHNHPPHCIPPELHLQQKYLYLQSQDCNKRIFGHIHASSKGLVIHIRGCDELIIGPESALQQKCLFIQEVAYLSFCNPQELWLQQKYLFLQSQDCNKRILGILGKIQESSEGFVFQNRECKSRESSKGLVFPIRNHDKSLIPPESGWQRNIYSPGVRIATRGSFARLSYPAKGSFSRSGIATNHSLLQIRVGNEFTYILRVRSAS